MDIPNDNPKKAAIIECAERIFRLIPEYPAIMGFDSPWHLLGIPELVAIADEMSFDDASDALKFAQYTHSTRTVK